MTDDADLRALVARLRDVQRLRRECKPIPLSIVYDECAAAAEAIESLLAERDALRAMKGTNED